MKIENFDITKKVFIVAELSANHNQDIEIAKDTIYAMKEAGADAVKLQTYTPDTITINSDKEYFQIKHGTLWDGQTLYQLYQKAYTPWEWHWELKEIAEKLGLIFFSSPFDKTAVDFLEKLNVPAYKIASPEITDIPLIKYIAKKQKPIILSTGIAKLEDIELAIKSIEEEGNNQIILLKCVSDYPTKYEEVNLLNIKTLKQTFGYPVGLSDHSLGISVPIASVALGARVIEKHFILSKDIDSPDKAFSLTPEEFKQMVEAVRQVEKALGNEKYTLTKGMEKGKLGARSLFAVKDIKKGEIFTEENVKSIRPNYGLHPKHLPKILGKKARKDIEKGTPLSWELVE